LAGHLLKKQPVEKKIKQTKEVLPEYNSNRVFIMDFADKQSQW
jgi:hypothetical protein